MEFTLWDIVRNLLVGLQWTLLLSLVAFVCGGIAGLLVLLARLSPLSAPRILARGYIELFQGTPLLMQLFLVFFGIALLGIDVSPWLAAATALTLFTSAFLAEIWRGCVESIPRGQWEASASLALNRYEQLRYIVLPQASRIAVAERTQVGPYSCSAAPSFAARTSADCTEPSGTSAIVFRLRRMCETPAVRSRNRPAIPPAMWRVRSGRCRASRCRHPGLPCLALAANALG